MSFGSLSNKQDIDMFPKQDISDAEPNCRRNMILLDSVSVRDVRERWNLFDFDVNF